MKSCSVKLKYGELIGRQENLPNGSKYFSFKGIPYAQPPKRFQQSVAIEKFSESPLDCTSERSIALQRDMFGSEYNGSEDCLFLNIYTPSLSGDKLPVMFFIHGGAFNAGSGDSDLYLPTYLVQEKIVVVTINYRLGPLGFLYLPTVGIHGNFGLKDQLLALKFVSKNIHSFGGNKNNITLFGESAGGVSVNFHFLSMESRKYFHKAICQSGVALNDWSLQIEPENKARKLARLLGCQEYNNDKKLYESLLQAPAVDLVRLGNHTVTEDEKRRSFIMPFRPVIEELNTNDPFIKENPLKLLQNKNLFANIPLITGVTDMEGIIMLKDCLSKTKAFTEDFCKYIPRSLDLVPDTPNAIKVGKNIKDYYFGSKPFDTSSEKEISDFMTDFHFAVQHYRNAEILARFQHKTTHYMYRFCFDGEMNMYKKFFSKTSVKGACHADELFYLFSQTMVDVPVEEGSREAKVRTIMCKLWTNFAKYGNPTPSNNELGFQWKPVTQTSDNNKVVPLNCLNIDETCDMIQNPDQNRINFWKEIYSKYDTNTLKPKL